MLHRGFVRPQLLKLVLREITDRKAAALVTTAASGYELARKKLDQRRLARPVGPEQTDARTGTQSEIDVLEHRRAAVGCAHRLERQQWIGRAFRFGEMKIERRVDVCRRDVLHAIERFQPALRLPRLGRFSPETFDEALEVRDLTLLLFVHCLL